MYKPKHLLTIAALFTPTSIVLAQIIAAPQTPGTPRPTVLQTANGVPQVDILTPSAAGVSRNTFQQFDVGQQGAILNNGRTASSTQLGGWVAANPWLAAGSAKVILNEVHSTNPSYLQGYVEIAGSKAELIIANPAGIHCNGCGFLNATHLQLATGTPQFSNGVFSGFAIGTGNIQINGAGMDASRVNFTEILTREARINANLWANHLRVTLAATAATAAATTDTAGTAATDSTPAPVFALDVARIGGMYAGKIWLIGTEHGLGVRNAGVLAATDELILTADGRLENRGSINAKSLHIAAPVIDNLGTGSIMGNQIAIAAERLNNLGASGSSPVITANTRLDIGTQELNNREHALIFSAGEMAIGDALDADQHATGTAQKISNASATIEALGDMQISTRHFSNTNENFATVTKKIGETQDQFYIQPEGAPEKVLAENFRWQPWSRAGRYRWRTDKSSVEDGVLGVTPMPGVGEENCTGDVGSETCTPLENAIYQRTDPAWQYFSLTPPDIEPTQPELIEPLPFTLPKPATADAAYDAALAAHQQAQAAYDTAQSAFTTAYKTWADTTAIRREALDQAITRYNYGFARTIIKSWTQYRVSHTELESAVSASDPSRLAAGGKLTLQGGQFINDKSQIFVGDRITGTFDSLTNIDAIGEHIVQEHGTSQYTRSQWRGGVKQYHQRNWGPVLAYAPADVVTTVRLPVTELIDNLKSIPSNTASDATNTKLQTVVERDLNSSSSLFKVNPDNLGPLFATDPRFTQYRQWLGSDTMLQKMASDPAITQKRLGDGFIEQKLVREQIAQLTGRRFLDGYASDEAEYAALMDSGLRYAKAWQLRPGIALTKEQVAQLTSDMVWMVEETISVTGKDGQPSTLEKVLVPKIYLVPREGDLHADGSLIAADQIDLHLNGELNNSGTIAGRTVVRLAAEKINNVGGEISAENVKLTAASDINNIGGSVHADSTLAVHAGGDLNVQSTTHRSRKDTLSSNITSAARTNLDRVASLYVTGTDGTLIATASRDINLQGARIDNAGDGSTVLFAGRDLNVGVVATSHRTASTDRRDTANYLRDSSTNEIGSDLHANGSLTLLANRDIHTQAASVVSDKGAIDVSAGRDISISTGESTRQTAQGTKITTSGFLSSTTITTREAHDSSQAVESVVSGATLHMNAGRDLQVKGSQIVSDKDTTLVAANNISLASSTETTHDTSYRHEKSSGLLATGGIGYTIGTRTTDTTQQSNSRTEQGSAVGALNGNVAIKAGNHYEQSASNVMAPAGSVNIDASAISITAATQTNDANWQSHSKQTGITVSISNPVVSAIQTVSQLAKAAGNTKDSRAQVLAVAAAGLTVANTAAAAQTGASPASDMTASVSIGTSKSSARSNQHAETAAPSVVAAAHDVTLQASGANKDDATLAVHGSQIMAGNNATLRAEGALELDAKANTATQTSSNRSSSASIGLTASMGAKGMQLGFTVAGSLGRGHADGDDLAWTNTQVGAGNTATLQSGGDTTLQGAIVTAQRIDAQVGGNLQIQSLQDTSTYDSQQQNISGSATIGPASGGNLSASQSKVDSTYASVTEQSGIKAGDGGFNVQVQGKTDLQGGVISSTEAAVQAKRNSFDTTALSSSDVHNHAAFSATATGINVGAGVSTDGKLAPSGSGVGIGHDSGSDSSVTQAGISGIAGNTAARTGDKPTGIAKIFDAASVEKDINAQVFITQTFSREAPRAVATYADSQVKVLQAQARNETDPARQAALKEDINHWQEGGAYRIALHAAAGGMAGGVGGAVGAGTAAAAAPLLNDLQFNLADKLKAAGANEQVANAAAAFITQTTAAGMGAVVSGGSVQGAAAALSTDANNRLLHQSEKDLIARKANGDKVTAERLTKAACLEIKCWAQFPEGSPLYNQNFVSYLEAAGLTQEIAWVNQQKIKGEFLYTSFQKLTDDIAATTRLSSVNGQGTFNGQFISKPNPPFMSNDCVTAECAAGMAPFRQPNPPDYVSAQGNFYLVSGGFTVNLHNGETFGQWGLGRSYPGYSITPGFSVNAGTILGGGNAKSTSEFLRGGGLQANMYVPPIPAMPILNFGGGLSHSYGGQTSVEFGISTQPGVSVTPISYGFIENDKSGAKK